MNTLIINDQTKSKKTKPKIIFIIVDEYDNEDEPIKNLLTKKQPAEPPARRTYYFPEEVFNIIKEWAGIYDIGINWDKKWSDIQSYYKLENYCPTIARMTQKYFRETGRDHPEIIRRAVWKDINTYIAPIPVYIEEHVSWNGEIVRRERRVGSVSDKEYRIGTGAPTPWLTEVEKKLVNRKEKFLNSLHDLAPTFEVPKWMKVGTQIGGGRIIKITKKNITIKLFTKVLISSVRQGKPEWHTYLETYRWIEEDEEYSKTITRSAGMRDYHEDNTMEWTRTYCPMDN